MSLKEKLMGKMMENHFRNMSSEEKNKMMDSMMDNFFSGMSDDEKKKMMSDMMPKMMGDNPMMGMMSMMMGKKGDSNAKMPWDMCGEMMSGFKETANTAKFATSELRDLFEEWCQLIEKEVLDFIKESKSIKIEELVAKFNLSEESIKYILSRLAGKNLIDYKV